MVVVTSILKHSVSPGKGLNVKCEAVGIIKCIIKADIDIDISSLDVISILHDYLIQLFDQKLVLANKVNFVSELAFHKAQKSTLSSVPHSALLRNIVCVFVCLFPMYSEVL